MAEKILRYKLPGWDEFYCKMPKGAVLLGVKRSRLLIKADPGATRVCRRFRVSAADAAPQGYTTKVGWVEGFMDGAFLFTDDKEYADAVPRD